MLLFLSLLGHGALTLGRLSTEENRYTQEICGDTATLFDKSKRVQRSMNTPTVRREEAPWSLLLKYAQSWNPKLDREIQFDESHAHCSGTLISSRHVLTAAHCFGPLVEAGCNLNETIEILGISMHRRNLDRFMVVAPEVCVGKDCPSEFSPRGLKIRKVFLSSRFILAGCLPKVYNQHEGDIAVIELEKDVDFSATVYPACLDDEPIIPGTKFTMFGYGRSNLPPAGILRKHETESKESCSIIDGVDEHLVCSTHCTGAACSGDSGAAQITFRENGTAYVSAVLIAGIPCSLIHHLRERGKDVQCEDINVRVEKHAGWICEVTGVCPSAGKEHLKTTTESTWERLMKLLPLKKADEPIGFWTMERLQGDDLYA